MERKIKKEFTFNEIMDAIAKMEPVYGRGALLFGYDTLEKALNDIGSGTMITLLHECDERANFYMGLRRSLVALHKALNGEDAADEERE